MADRQKSHFGTDGYKDLERREDAAKKVTRGGNSLGDKIRKNKEKEVIKLRKEDKQRKLGR